MIYIPIILLIILLIIILTIDIKKDFLYTDSINIMPLFEPLTLNLSHSKTNSTYGNILLFSVRSFLSIIAIGSPPSRAITPKPCIHCIILVYLIGTTYVYSYSKPTRVLITRREVPFSVYNLISRYKTHINI